MPKRRLLRTKLWLALLSLCTLAPAGFYGTQAGEPQQAQPPSQAEAKTMGVPWAGPLGIQESVADIMRRESQRRALGLPPDVTPPLPVRLRPFLDLPQNPRSPNLPRWPPPPVGQTLRETETTSFLPQTLGTSFTGATLNGINPTFAFPPDSMGAVGPTQYVVMVNNRIVTFNKSTGIEDGVLNTTTNTFFDSVRNAAGTSDPRIRYDRLSQRWFLIIINVSTPNRILIAVSDSASNGILSATTVFTFFFIPIDTTPPAISSTCLADYPTLGVDANALYIGTNNFCGTPTQTSDSTDGYVVRKSSILGAGPLVVTVFRALSDVSPLTAGPFTPQGVDNYDPAATEGYFVGVDLLTFGTLMLRRVSDPGGTPSISANIAITVPATTFPENVPHLGMILLRKLDALDDRLFAAHIRNGRLWTAHNIEVNTSGVASTTGGRTGVRWYELEGIVSPGTPSVRQAGTVFDSFGINPRFFWIPSILVSGQGHAALGFSTAGVDFRADAATVGRLRSDPLGAQRATVLYTSSTTAYNAQTTNTQRWGDYSYTSLDPNDDMTMWTIQEFCDATNSYGVRVVKLMAPPPATPSSASTSVPTGQSSVNVTITGTSVSGSEFYDPGPGTGFSHINATVSGGVVVNSVTYNSPTQITLNLNTTAASAGAKDVTITNPDGQSVTGTGILTVTGTSGSFSNSATITLNDSPTPPTTATPYPSSITVAGLTGAIAKVVVKLNGFNHALPDDVDVLLLSPTGATAIIMSDVGGTTSVAGINLTLDDAAASSLPDVGPLVSGVFRPTNIDTADSFPSPAPTPSGAAALTVFNGSNPNGVWSLYVVDDGVGNSGAFAGGWTLEIVAGKKRRGQITSE